MVKIKSETYLFVLSYLLNLLRNCCRNYCEIYFVIENYKQIMHVRCLSNALTLRIRGFDDASESQCVCIICHNSLLKVIYAYFVIETTANSRDKSIACIRP